MAFLFPENRMQTDAGKTAAIAAGDCKLRRRSGQLTDVAVIFVAKVSSHWDSVATLAPYSEVISLWFLIPLTHSLRHAFIAHRVLYRD